jgi:tRNA A-37 threonylcarbamoyl transferase component Bud32
MIVGQERYSDPFIGVVLGTKYRIEEKIGEGGMGQIYMARHVTLKKRYAVKMLNAEFSKNQEAVERFRREATTAGELDHPNIINVTDIDYTDDGRAYIVMEYLEGRELREDLTRTPILPADRLVRLFTQVCRALDAAHSRGIVHRDLKPENIFVIDLPDQPDTVKLLDFGISKIKTAGATNLTQTGMVIGTPHYMAPEQARGDRDIDHRADIYALGAILYEACTGHVPATGETATAILMKILLELPVPPRQLNPALSPELEAVIQRAMQKDPSYRFQSCNEMAEAIKHACGLDTSMMAGVAVSTGMGPQAPLLAYPTAAQGAPSAYPVPPPTGMGVAPPPPPGYGTAQTPMTWTGAPSTATTAAVEPPRKKGSAVLIAIPVVLVLVLLLGGGAVAALFLTGIIGGRVGDVGEKGQEVAAKGPTVKEDAGAKGGTAAKETHEGVGEEAGGTVAPGLDEESKVIIKFTTTPDGADVVLKIGTHERNLCVTDCTHDFNKTDKVVTVVLRKDGYKPQTLEFAPDFNKELVTNLTHSGSKKDRKGTVVKELGSDTTPKPAWEIQPKETEPKPGEKKKPIIKVIGKSGGSSTEGTDSGKKPPAIKIIKSPK